MLYTDAVKAIVKQHEKTAPHHGIVFHVVEYPGYLTIRLYRDNYEEFSEDQKVGIGLWVGELITAIRTVTPCYLEVFESVPTR